MREGRHSVLEGVPASLPPLVKAVRMQEKAAGMGFEFRDVSDAHAKVEEEYKEFIEALEMMHNTGCKSLADDKFRDHANEELGDLLFAIIKWARFEGLNADDALSAANQKFYRRFSYVESMAQQRGLNISDMSLEQLTALWNEAKSNDL